MNKLRNEKAIILGLLTIVLALVMITAQNNRVYASGIQEGIALNNITNVYVDTSRDSKVLKSYSQGSVLKYKSHSGSWYSTSVYINGNKTSGYINKSDVENVIVNQERLSGIGLKNPTAVYARAATNSKKLKTYVEGSVLKYRTFSDNWYQTTVYLSGKATTGYIHKSDIENAISNQERLSGIGLKNRTAVYARGSTNSKALKTYAEGSVLQYRTFSENWYQTTVYLNGKATTGYIHASHVEGVFGTSQSLDGMSLKSPTNVYSRASKKASVLRNYPNKRYLQFKTFSPNWYEATVILNGTRTTGYIHRDDVSVDKVSVKTTSYSTDFNRVVDIQMTKAPQVSGRYGGWENASRAQVEYYVNSSNFSKISNDYYQFLVLSEPANLNANEVNQKILYNHGTLTGKAADFISAGKKFNVNEAYLISHALLETGNGTSTLAQGVPVDNKGNVVAESQKIYTVYNMYGIGAVDSNALKGGAKRAFNEGWFTPQAAIIGGAEFINTYITRGQDTLYKMRWSPSSPGYPQYATDIAWATKQTVNISRIYNLLDRYVLIYDVPRYMNQPSSSGNPNSLNLMSPMMRSMMVVPTDSTGNNEPMEDPSTDQEVESGESPEIDQKVESEETAEIDQEVESEETPEIGQEVESEETPEIDVEVESEETPEIDEEVGTEEIPEIDEEVETEETPGIDEEVESEETPEVDEEVESEETPEIEEGQVYGIATDELELREVSNDITSEVYLTIPEETRLEITAIDGTWFETKYEDQTGWVNGDSVTLLNLLEVKADNLNLYEEPNESSNLIATKMTGELLVAVLDEEDTLILEEEWYQVLYNGEKVWVNGGKDSEKIIEVK